jgi:hypothetical protein
MESSRILAISTLKALIELSEMEEERLHAILDDEAEDTKTREEALAKLAAVLQDHRLQLERLAAFET